MHPASAVQHGYYFDLQRAKETALKWECATQGTKSRPDCAAHA